MPHRDRDLMRGHAIPHTEGSSVIGAWLVPCKLLYGWSMVWPIGRLEIGTIEKVILWVSISYIPQSIQESRA